MAKRADYTGRDAGARRAKREGFAARSVYKLDEIDRRFKLLRRGMAVLDLGACPGSWSQYALARVGDGGLVVVLVDLRRDPAALDRKMVDWLGECDRRGLLVLTKADRVSKSRRISHQARICKGLGVPKEASMLYSSHEDIGRKELWRRIREATR